MNVLYLDFDGVAHGGGATLHRVPPRIRPELSDHTLFEHLPVLEGLLDPYPDVQLVLSTSWVRALDFKRAKGYLTLSLQQRVVGATYHARMMTKYEFDGLQRNTQILADVGRRRPQRWIAVDDDFGEGVPEWAWKHFVQTPWDQGLGCPAAVDEMKRRLATIFATDEGK